MDDGPRCRPVQLGALFSHVEGVSGSTILGDGDVALIIDVPSLVARAQRQDRAQTRRSA